MNSIEIGKYLGLSIIVLLVIYITKEVMVPKNVMKEGLTSNSGITSLENYLDQLKKRIKYIKNQC